MPIYRTQEYPDALIDHDGPVGSRFDHPCLCFKIKFIEKTAGPQHIANWNKGYGFGGHAVPFSRYQLHSIISKGMFEQVGLSAGRLKADVFPVTRALLNSNDEAQLDHKGKVFLRTTFETVQTIETAIRVIEYPLIDPDKLVNRDQAGHKSKRESQGQKITFIIPENLPTEKYMCLGYDFISSHLQELVKPERIQGRFQYSLTARVEESFCDSPVRT